MRTVSTVPTSPTAVSTTTSRSHPDAEGQRRLRREPGTGDRKGHEEDHPPRACRNSRQPDEQDARCRDGHPLQPDGSAPAVATCERRVRRAEDAHPEEQAGQQRAGVLPHPVEGHGGHEPVEQAAGRTAHRDDEVEARQVLHGRPQGGETGVGHVGDQSQDEQVEADRDRDGDREPDERHREHQRRQRHGSTNEHRRHRPRLTREGHHEGREVQRQRHHPQERDRRDIGRDV